jgi:hypothetical protein
MSDGNHKASRSLLDHEWPLGFEKNGRRLLAECKQFHLYELYHEGGPRIIECSERIEKIRQRLFFTTNDAEGSEKRIAWSEALLRLTHMSQGKQGGDIPLAKRLADTIGKEISDMLLDEKTVEECTATFKTALLAIQRNNLKPEYLLLLHAEGYFMGHGKLPTKTLLIQMVEKCGYNYTGKNKRSDWLKRLTLVELDDLPE